MNDTKPIKPLGKRAYGSIPHLPGSRRGPSDKGLSDQQAAILTDKAMALAGMATVTIEHRKGPSIEDAQAAILAARQKIADKSKAVAIDV